jgi:sec-independent protein translocase protein TatA
MGIIPVFISGSEIIIVFLIVLLLFGADKIPEIARGLGKGMKEFRKITGDLKQEFQESAGGLKDDIDEIKKDVDQTKENLTGEFRKYVDDSDINKDINEIKDDLKG